MNWTRCFSLPMREVVGASKFFFIQALWNTMLRCQGGHDLREAQAIFGVEHLDAQILFLRHALN